MSARFRYLLICVPLGLLAGCVGGADETDSAAEALEAVACDPDRADCERGEECIEILAANEERLDLCGAEECVDRNGCREGYECARGRCLRTREPEREPERDLCREGVPGIPFCADGFVAEPIDRHCWQCVPTRDPEREPEAVRPEEGRPILVERPGDHERLRRYLAGLERLRRARREEARRRDFDRRIRRPGDADLRERPHRADREPSRRTPDDDDRE